MSFPTNNKWTAAEIKRHTLCYGLALASVAAAFALARMFLYFHLPQPFTSFAMSAIAITFWYGGAAPGILAAALSILIRTYLFQENIRSEEHTSELQSPVHLVCRLLLEKKKKK